MKPALMLATLVFFTLNLLAGPAQVDLTKTIINANCSATGHHFDASPQKYSLTIELDETGERPQAIRLHFQFQDLKTGKEKRDIEMLHWLEAEAHPDLEFNMTRYEGDGQSGKLHGTLRFHNVSKEIVIPVKLEKKDHIFRMQGDMELNYKDFNLPLIRKMLMLTVDPEMQIHIDVIAHH